MKIGTLTFHDGPNHGAFLQTYALMHFLQTHSYDVQIINYKNICHSKKEGYHQLAKYRRPIRFYDFFLKRYAFQRAHRFYNFTAFTTNPREIKKLHFDIAIVGSDVVWNYKIFGYDELFFCGLNAKKQIAYAPSFGYVNASETIPVNVQWGIQKFDFISVRDENSQRIVYEITGKKPPLVLDPTFLVDFSSFEEITDRIISLKPFILIYATQLRKSEIQAIKLFAKQKGLITVAVGYRQAWCDKNWMGVGPQEWLGFFYKARYVVTNTFHGTVFSVKYKKPVAVSMHNGIKNRVIPLLKLCNIESLIFGTNEVVPFKDNGVVLSFDEFALQEKVAFSKNWLLNILKQNGVR